MDRFFWLISSNDPNTTVNISRSMFANFCSVSDLDANATSLLFCCSPLLEVSTWMVVGLVESKYVFTDSLEGPFAVVRPCIFVSPF